jgi:hypothetical protein
MIVRRILLCVSVVLPSFAGGSAASDWGIYGATICAVTGDRSTNTSWSLAASDGAGGAYMGWSDSRSGIPRIFLQRVTSGGGPAPGWVFHGTPVTPGGAVRQVRPALAADPTGGVFMVWLEGEESWDNPFLELRVTRLGGNGAPKAPWPAPGVVVTSAAFSNSEPAVVPDASGGAYVMWHGHPDPETYALYLHHILNDGSLDPVWPAGGLIVAPSTDLIASAIAPDGLGGVLMAWNQAHYPEDGFHYRAQRILMAGAPAPGWDPSGVLIQTTTTPNNTWRAPGIVPDGSGGAVVTFREFKAGEEHFGLYARRVLGNGQFAAGWAITGTPVASAPPEVGPFATVTDGAGGAILIWEEFEFGFFPPWRIWAQRLSANGSVPAGWPTDGRRVGSADRGGVNPVAMADGAGGAFVTWTEQVTADQSAYDRLHVHHLKADGSDAPGWGTEGAEFAPGTPNSRTQADVSLAYDGTQGIFAFWTDYTVPPTDTKVLGQHFNPAPPTDVGPLVGSSKSLRIDPNPAFAAANVRLRLAEAAHVSVTIHDIAGRRVRTLVERTLVSAGEAPWTWDLHDDDGRRVAPGVYRIVVRRDQGAESAPVVVLR